MIVSISSRSLLFLLALLFFASFLRAGPGRMIKAEGASPERIIRLTVLYDNYLSKEGTQSDWGFSCLIEGTEKTILFDTGAKPQILMKNIDALAVDLKKVELIVISHNHGDHTGGLPAVLERNPNVTVYYPGSFPLAFERQVRDLKAGAQSVGQPVQICGNVHLTGEMGDAIKEQSLVIDTPRGLIIVTGCSHPGIAMILRRAKEILDRPIHLVLGGFHLGAKTNAEIREIAAMFKAFRIEKCGPTHCTGDKPIAAFKAAFEDNCIPMGTGKVIEVPGF